MGIFDIFKKTRMERGKEAEDLAKSNLSMIHDKVKRVPIGSDFGTVDKDLLTGKTKRQKWEVKRNNSPLTKRQKQTKGLKVIRVKDGMLGYETSVENRRGDKLEYNYLSGRHERVPKAQKSDPYGVNSMLRLSSVSSKRKSRKTDDMFGMGDILGNVSSSGRKRRRKNDLLGF